MPAGVSHVVDVDGGGVMFPVEILIRNLPQGTADSWTVPAVYTLGDAWLLWLLHHFSATYTPMRHPGYRKGDVLPRLAEGSSPVDVLAIPRSGPARHVAEALLANPGDLRSVENWAASVAVSPQTLRRQFAAETGRSFTGWRTHCRVQAATEFLAAGFAVEWVADTVGYATPSGFIRAFRRLTGVTPGEWAVTGAADDRHRTSSRVRKLRGQQLLADRLSNSSAGAAPGIPATVAAPRTYSGNHVLLWMFAGTATVEIAGEPVELSTGDAVWMPANLSHAVNVDADSVALPIVFRLEDVILTRDDVAVVHVPPSLRTLMLAEVVANLTPIAPEGGHVFDVRAFLGDQLIRTRSFDLAVPETPAAARVARGVLDALTGTVTAGEKAAAPQVAARDLTDWAEVTGVTSKTLGIWFRKETGKTFRQWRMAARMRAAASLLRNGVRPSVVARRVGYAHLSAFSRDFRNQVGMSPREYVGEG